VDSPTDRLVLLAVLSGGPLDPASIAERTLLAVDDVCASLGRLVAAGLLAPAPSTTAMRQHDTSARNEAVWAWHATGLTVRKIARRTGLPKSTVHNIIQAGRAARQATSSRGAP
jgi:DNA-binding IclR family transcriptional regulator